MNEGCSNNGLFIVRGTRYRRRSRDRFNIFGVLRWSYGVYGSMWGSGGKLRGGALFGQREIKRLTCWKSCMIFINGLSERIFFRNNHCV